MDFKKVKDFTKACGNPCRTVPTILTRKDVLFIKKMVTDELEELERAKDVIDQADAFMDIIYYVMDRATQHGIDLDKVFDIVHNANMSKVVDGKVIRRDDGKILKPRGWIDPYPLLQKQLLKK